MSKLLIATANKNKVKEISNILSSSFKAFCTFSDFDLDSPVEDANTFEGNALIKARYGSTQTGLPTLADDSGLCVDYLQGEPGVYSSRYAKEGDDIANYKKLLKNLERVQYDDRMAFFFTSMVMVFPQGQEITVSGKLEGYISESPKGKNGFGYDPVFYLPEYQKTLAELDFQTKNRISHRKKALENLLPELRGE
ncbi:RdgB/HAM1 family non-canonical purine NTP pyrophosphatase [Proteinivorax tanatarense]|uniref:dITP/XTP pyrophosphatase n=1 Tax=Proteinivorax tanatarense TaxID=1260629 RepID=A0AAU7VIL5_9FIRM